MFLNKCVVDPGPYVFGPSDPDPSLFVQIRILPSTSKKVRKILIPTIFLLLFYLLYLKTDVNVPSKSNTGMQNNLEKKNMSATDEKSRMCESVIRIPGSGSVPKCHVSTIHNTA